MTPSAATSTIRGARLEVAFALRAAEQLGLPVDPP